MFRNILKTIQLALQITFWPLKALFKTSKTLFLFIVVIIFFHISKVEAQQVSNYHAVYFSPNNANDCGYHYSDYDDTIINFALRTNILIPDRFYYTSESYQGSYTSSITSYDIFCKLSFVSQSTSLLKVVFDIYSKDKISNSAGTFSQNGSSVNKLGIFAYIAPVDQVNISCRSDQELIYARHQTYGYISYCKNQQLRYSNQSCLMKYNSVLNVYHKKTDILDNSTELTSYVDHYSIPDNIAYCRLSYKLQFKEDKNCVYKKYFYNGLHYDEGSILIGSVIPVDLVTYQQDECSYILMDSYNPPTPDWDPEVETPVLGEVGSAFDPTKDYNNDGKLDDDDFTWCVEYEYGCRVCLDGNCEAWPPNGGGGNNGGGGDGGDGEPPVNCDLAPEDPSCVEPPINCELNPTDPSCVETPPIDCELNPTDPSCVETPPIDCELNPEDPTCPEVEPEPEPEPETPPISGGPCPTGSYVDENGSTVAYVCNPPKSWIDSKYPFGIKGVLDAHINKVTASNSPLYSVGKFFTWNHSSSANYPVFDLNFQFSFADLGTHKIDFSDMFGFNFWLIAKAFILIAFGFAAFRISFGG